MRKIIIVAVVLVLLLGACVVAEDVPVEPEATTERTTLQAMREVTRELSLSDAITVFELNWQDIWIRDETTGEETPLLESYTNEWGAPIVYFLEDWSNERFFAFRSAIVDTCASSGVMFYDVEQRRTVQKLPPWEHWEGAEFFRVNNGRIYLVERHGMRATPDYFDLFYVEISAMESGEPVAVYKAGTIPQEEWQAAQNEGNHHDN